jgi:hypothetical protein
MASTLTPKEGTVQECKTSAEVIINREGTKVGIKTRLSTSKLR